MTDDTAAPLGGNVERRLAIYGHGHVVPRTDGAKARCGGPSICTRCAIDADALRDERSGRTGEPS